MKTNFRWLICSLLFLATTVNYLDRQVLSLTVTDISREFGWTDADYGVITFWFSIIYAVSNMFAGKVIDRLGTRKGYLWAIFIWSVGACLHAGCGAASAKVVGLTGMALATVSVWMFVACRAILAVGESGNFPAAVKVATEYFPKKDRAFATSIFNAGSSVGAIAAPLTIPVIANFWGWKSAFVIIGALGFAWMGFWMWFYRKPEESPHVNAGELAYINQDADDESNNRTAEQPNDEPKISYAKAFSLKQTWALVLGRFLTDGVWWFFLFWTPKYFLSQFGYDPKTGVGMALMASLYAIVTVVSVVLCKMPTYMIVKKGMNAYEGRMVAMFVFACFPLFALGAQPLGAFSAWWPAILIGLACAGHQAWSANIYSVVGDMFPKSVIGTVTGIAQFAAGCGSALVNWSAGMLFSYASGTALVDGAEVEMTGELLAQGERYVRPAMEFLGHTGKPAGYCIVFGYCAVAYLIGWCCMKGLVPKYRKVEL